MVWNRAVKKSLLKHFGSLSFNKNKKLIILVAGRSKHQNYII
jgi:hypothetical protein